MPVEFIYLLALLVTISIFFVVLKRPIYEGMLAGYIVMLAITGQWQNAFTYVYQASTNTLFYAIVAFMVVAQIFTGTRVIDACVDVVLSIFGRVKGGTGYVALIASSFMGALSGSAAGNVAATGVFTIPAMKRSGYPDYPASNICMAPSTLRNLIPPPAILVPYLCTLTTLHGHHAYTITQPSLLWSGLSTLFIATTAVHLLCSREYPPPPTLRPRETPML